MGGRLEGMSVFRVVVVGAAVVCLAVATLVGSVAVVLLATALVP